MVTSKEIYKEALFSANGSILVEGVGELEYPDYVSYFMNRFEERDGKTFDFCDLLSLSSEGLYHFEFGDNVFVYNVDLFGNETCPEKATGVMSSLRKKWSASSHSFQLMLARPCANLDFWSDVSGFNFHDNHPLGNWCDFYHIDSGNLVRDSYPLKHDS